MKKEREKKKKEKKETKNSTDSCEHGSTRKKRVKTAFTKSL
jgi:hypothetical protein